MYSIIQLYQLLSCAIFSAGLMLLIFMVVILNFLGIILLDVHIHNPSESEYYSHKAQFFCDHPAANRCCAKYGKSSIYLIQ